MPRALSARRTADLFCEIILNRVSAFGGFVVEIFLFFLACPAVKRIMVLAFSGGQKAQRKSE